MEFGKIIFGILGLCLLSEYSDAAITGWTNPIIATKDGSAVATSTIAENLAAGTTTGNTIAATATAPATIASYTLTTTTVSGATFSITSPAGLLTFASGTLDFETAPALVVVIEAVDSTGVTATATVTVSVTNIDEAPVFTAGTISYLMVADGSGEGTTVTTLGALDPEAATVVGYTITSGNTPAMFTMAGADGKITVATGKTLAAATTPAYVLVAEANDGTNTATATLIVIVGSCSSGVAGLTISMVTVLIASLVAFLK